MAVLRITQEAGNLLSGAKAASVVASVVSRQAYRVTASRRS